MGEKYCIYCGEQRPRKWRGLGWRGVKPMGGGCRCGYTYWACRVCNALHDLQAMARVLSVLGKRYPNGLMLQPKLKRNRKDQPDA